MEQESAMNLPPGCSINAVDPPGQLARERTLEWLCSVADGSDLEPDEMMIVWEMGLAAWKAARDCEVYTKAEADQRTLEEVKP